MLFEDGSKTNYTHLTSALFKCFQQFSGFKLELDIASGISELRGSIQRLLNFIKL